MVFVLSCYLMLTIVLSVCNGNRRLVGGKDVTTDHQSMVYLRKAEKDPSGYIAWLCGGTLVGSKEVLTSAACVEDVQLLYVVAGYDQYVSDQTKKDTCLQNTIRKVIHICVPKAYTLQYYDLEKWSYYDIALVKVDKSIIGDPSYEKYCSYAPKVIDINYDNEDLQAEGKEAIILGWGHHTSWREANDNRDFNQKTLQYVATLIYNQSKCADIYKPFGMEKVIEKFMICTLHPAAFDDTGDTIQSKQMKLHDGCETQSDIKEQPIAEDSALAESQEMEHSRKHNKIKNKTVGPGVGICQNDHGGPLISWVRGKPKVIGVASVFRVENKKCTGPYLFTSTYCSSSFLNCVMLAFTEGEAEGRRAMPDYCYLPPKEKGFDIIERRITWKKDKEEKNKVTEKYLVRPQKPLQRRRSEENKTNDN